MVQRYQKKLKSTSQSLKGNYWSPPVWRIVGLEEYDPSVTKFLSFSREARNFCFISNMKSAGLRILTQMHAHTPTPAPCHTIESQINCIFFLDVAISLQLFSLHNQTRFKASIPDMVPGR